jgi:hypothetical protein
MARMRKCVSLMAGALLSFCFAACNGSGSDNEEGACIMCDFGGGAVRCHLGFGAYQDICAPDQTLAAINCSEIGGQWEALPLCTIEPPAETGEGPGAVPWNPTDDVTFDPTTGEYVIDRQAFEQLKQDPTPLLDDTSQLRQLESGHYELVKAGDLAEALGWMTGDVLLALDGYVLEGMDALAVLYPKLADDTEFELMIQRGRTKLLLRYRIE